MLHLQRLRLAWNAWSIELGRKRSVGPGGSWSTLVFLLRFVSYCSLLLSHLSLLTCWREYSFKFFLTRLASSLGWTCHSIDASIHVWSIHIVFIRLLLKPAEVGVSDGVAVNVEMLVFVIHSGKLHLSLFLSHMNPVGCLNQCLV